MRTRPLVGKKLWFGPRGFGWGWAPVSWEGWVVVVTAIVAFFTMSALFGDGEHTVLHAVVTAAIIAGAVIGCIAKGTPPGGRRQAEEFKRERARGSL